MTIDDDSSIYVGGLPYDIGEENLRKVFYIYGAVVAVKIINDRNVGGKCYGFVTFANPRSATQAIREMDGKTIDGRTVRVNEVRTRGGRPNFSSDIRRDSERDINGNKGSDHGRYDMHDRHRHWEGRRERSLDPDLNKPREHDHVDGYDRTKDRHMDEDRIRDHNIQMEGVEHENKKKRDRDWGRESDINIEEQKNNKHKKTGDNDKHQRHSFLNRSSIDDRDDREHSMESLNDEQIINKLAISNQKLEELRMEIHQMEEVAAGQQEVTSVLREKCQNLEDSLFAAKKKTSYHHLQLAKLHKCYLQLRDYNERLKNSEQEFQLLIDSTAMELGNDGAIVGLLSSGRS